MSAKKPDLQCAECEFSYSNLGDYCFRHPEIKCPHPLNHAQEMRK